MDMHTNDVVREFSSESTDALACALLDFLAMRSDDRQLALRRALGGFCREAHARHLGPEKMLIAAKAVWKKLPKASGLDHLRVSAAFDAALVECLESYYESHHAPTKARLELPEQRVRRHS